MSFLKFLESRLSNNNLIVVDIQPIYENYIHFSLIEFVEYLYKIIKSGRRVLYYYNGDSIGSEDNPKSIVNWLVSSIGYIEDVDISEYYFEILNGCEFIDKGYGFLRDLMDSGHSEREIIQVVRYMVMNKISDSRDIPEGIFDFGNNTVFLPSFSIAKLKEYNGSFLVGGGQNECLKEVQLIANALNIKVTLMKKFIF